MFQKTKGLQKYVIGRRAGRAKSKGQRWRDEARDKAREALQRPKDRARLAGRYSQFPLSQTNPECYRKDGSYKNMSKSLGWLDAAASFLVRRDDGMRRVNPTSRARLTAASRDGPKGEGRCEPLLGVPARASHLEVGGGLRCPRPKSGAQRPPLQAEIGIIWPTGAGARAERVPWGFDYPFPR